MMPTSDSRTVQRSKEAVESCPVFIASRILGKRWTILILQSLMTPSAQDGLRFNEIHKSLDWISAKVLSGRLKELVNEGIVKREKQSPNEGEEEIDEIADPFAEIIEDINNEQKEANKPTEKFLSEEVMRKFKREEEQTMT